MQVIIYYHFREKGGGRGKGKGEDEGGVERRREGKTCSHKSQIAST